MLELGIGPKITIFEPKSEILAYGWSGTVAVPVTAIREDHALWIAASPF
jgi:hypothetical protein